MPNPFSMGMAGIGAIAGGVLGGISGLARDDRNFFGSTFSGALTGLHAGGVRMGGMRGAMHIGGLVGAAWGATFGGGTIRDSMLGGTIAGGISAGRSFSSLYKAARQGPWGSMGRGQAASMASRVMGRRAQQLFGRKITRAVNPIPGT